MRRAIHTPYRDPQADARIVTYCDECSGEIYEGDDYYTFGNRVMRERCVEDCRTTAELPDDPFVMEDDDGGML